MYSGSTSGVHGISGSKINIYAQKEALIAKAADFIIEDALKSDSIIYKLNKKGTYTFHINLHDRGNDISELDIKGLLKSKLENYITREMNCSLLECVPRSVAQDDSSGRNWKLNLTIRKNSTEKLKLPQSKEVAQQALLINHLQEALHRKNTTISAQEDNLSLLNAKIAILEKEKTASLKSSQQGYLTSHDLSTIVQLQHSLATQASLNTQQEELINHLLESNVEQNKKIDLVESQLKERDGLLESHFELMHSQVKEQEFESQIASMQKKLTKRDAQLERKAEVISALEDEMFAAITASTQQIDQMQKQLKECDAQFEDQQSVIAQMGEARIADQQQLDKQKRSLGEISETVNDIITKFTCQVDFELFNEESFITPSGNTFNSIVLADIEKRGVDPFEVPTTKAQIYTNRVVIETSPLLLKLQAQLAEALPQEVENKAEEERKLG